MQKYNQGLFYDWVPKPIMLLLIMILALVLFSISPIYTANISYMVSSLGAMTEDLIWANYASVIGMGLAMPLFLRLKARFRVKEILTTSFVGMAFLFWVMATTDQTGIIIGASLLIGFLKMLGMMEILLPLMAILSSDGNRGRFYSIFYTSVLIMSQVSGYYITSLSYHYNWQHAYLVIAAICLATALLCLSFLHNLRFMRKVPLYYIDWLSALLFTLCFLVLAYILAFGKQQAWFDSTLIKEATAAFLILLFTVIIRQQLMVRPFLPLKAFSRSNVLHGILMLAFLGMYLALANVQNIFTIGILGYNPLRNASLNLMMIPGLLLGAVVSLKWFNRRIPVKMLIFSGFAAFLFYTVILYFSMVLEFSYEGWMLPMFFRGYGMGVLFVSIWYYTLDKLGMHELLAAIGFILVWRTFISLGAFTSLLSWVQYRLQWQEMGNLSVYVDDTILFSPNNNFNLRSIQLNGMLAANKTLLGYLCIVGIGILIYVIFHRFGKTQQLLLRIRMGRNKKFWISRQKAKR